ncbi:MAG: PocR ligand-binding domain-containing protein, partial [Eubacteriales bacterium]
MATGIYALISKERISDVLSTLQEFIDIPIQLIDTNGQVLQQYGKVIPYCSRLKQTIFKPEECAKIHMKAGEHARTLGEAYIFTCHAELSHIAFPLIHNNELIGTVIAGPFLMENPDSTLVSGLLEKYAMTPALSIELLDMLSELSVLQPNRVNVLKKLMEQLLSPLLPMERILLMQTQEKMSYQSKINETIQLYKEQKTPSTRDLLYHKENALITKVRIGDIDGAKTLMNELLAYIIYTDGASVDDFRVQAIELSSMISRVVLESGVSAERIHKLQ